MPAGRIRLSDAQVLEQMRSDWNRRAREDANYYVAFGRRDQEEAEFSASAADVVRLLKAELKRISPTIPADARRALEIGCGPGRLMRLLSCDFAEMHGVDVSDEMIRLARTRLADVPHARLHTTAGADLSPFLNDYFDFVYSYAVFQHIPSREVVFRYVSEARRVLKTGGILKCQFNGLPDTGAAYTSWEGVRISAQELAAFAREHDLQLLALEGEWTQYLWVTCRKQPEGWSASLARSSAPSGASIRSINNSYSGEAAVPAAGRFAVASLWIENLPPESDLNHLQVMMDGAPGKASYIGPPDPERLSQVNVALPSSIRTGLVPVEVSWNGQPLCATPWMRIVPLGPSVPRVVSITDGVNLLAGTRILSRCVKAILEEILVPESFHAEVDGALMNDVEFFRTDPLTERFEFNIRLPAAMPAGGHQLELSLGKRRFPTVPIEVV